MRFRTRPAGRLLARVIVGMIRPRAFGEGTSAGRAPGELRLPIG
jgi:hypothetical protein